MGAGLGDRSLADGIVAGDRCGVTGGGGTPGGGAPGLVEDHILAEGHGVPDRLGENEPVAGLEAFHVDARRHRSAGSFLMWLRRSAAVRSIWLPMDSA